MITITLAAGIILASGVSMKDAPVEHRSAPMRTPGFISDRPRLPERPIPPIPDANIQDRMDRGDVPYVYVQGATGRLAMTPEEMQRYGLSTGDVVKPSLANKIIIDKLERSGL